MSIQAKINHIHNRIEQETIFQTFLEAGFKLYEEMEKAGKFNNPQIHELLGEDAVNTLQGVYLFTQASYAVFMEGVKPSNVSLKDEPTAEIYIDSVTTLGRLVNRLNALVFSKPEWEEYQKSAMIMSGGLGVVNAIEALIVAFHPVDKRIKQLCPKELRDNYILSGDNVPSD